MSKRIIKLAELRDPFVLLATGFGSGLSKIAPGTVGTVASLLLFVFFYGTQTMAYAVFCLIAFFAGIVICQRASSALGVHDHGGIVWDEFVGMWLTLLWVPLNWQTFLVGFILFRVFDIIKPWPIGWLDKQVDGGMGIMIDDVIAALFANICLQVLLFWSVLSA